MPILGLRTGQEVVCLESKTGERIKAKVTNVNDNLTRLTLYGGQFIELTPTSDVELVGQVVVFNDAVVGLTSVERAAISHVEHLRYLENRQHSDSECFANYKQSIAVIERLLRIVHSYRDATSKLPTSKRVTGRGL